MAYGYRLNVEDIFFKLAEDNFATASRLVGIVSDNREEDGKDASFRGYPTEEALAAVAIAIVGWAVALEAFSNQAWRKTLEPNLPRGHIQNLLLKQLSTPEKLKEIVKHFQLDTNVLPWWGRIPMLFQLRNEFVHFKQEMAYQGFSFAPDISRRLSEKDILALRESVAKAIREVGKLCGIPCGFLDGNYELATINA